MNLRLLTSLALSALLVTACSDDEDAAGGEDGVPACTLTPTAEVRTTLGEPALGEPDSNTINPTVNVCSYPDQDISAKVIIRYEVDISDESWASNRKGFDESGQPTTSVPGLGDDAFTSSIGTTQILSTSIVARKGSRGVQVVATVPFEQVRALTASILTRL